MNEKFTNACNRVEQSCPPIWMMRQAGRYQQPYMEMKERFTFEQMCKLPRVAADVAMLPIDQFDFDIAILFSDILFPIEGLGVPLKFAPGPQFDYYINEENYREHKNISRAVEHMEFQKVAVAATREKLHKSKSLIGFVGGPWTLLNYATGKKPNMDLKWKAAYMEEVIVPVLTRNIHLQLEAGAEKVMILDSGVGNMSESFFKTHYINILQPLIQTDTGYYTQHLNHKCLPTLYRMGWSGIGIDHTVDMQRTFKKYQDGFIQGNFDEKLMMTPKPYLEKEITEWLDSMEHVDRTGWVCGLGHGIHKETPEANVKLFVDMVRERYS
jgi:uroporphyrinogen decarboxylase